MHSAWELLVVGTGWRHPLRDGARVTVGRTGDCEIRLDDQVVSRRHCTVERRGSELIVTDLDSANGTFLNDRLIRSATAAPGDVIRVGGPPSRSADLEPISGAVPRCRSMPTTTPCSR
jgi:hypothetical protein